MTPGRSGARVTVAALAVTLILTAVGGTLLVGDDPAGGGGGGVAAPPDGPGANETPSASAGPGERPNVVVIMADDMRADDMRYMPATRRIFRRHGVEFENSFSPNPLCCPARASFLTGTYSHNHEVVSHVEPYGFRAFDDSRTLATALRRGGYQTGFVGKYLNGYGKQDSLVTGRNSARYVPGGWTDWHGAIQSPPGGLPRPLRGGTYQYFDTTFNVNGKLEPHDGEYQTSVIGRKARGLISQYATSSKPFFVWVNPVAPHHGVPREPDDPDKIRGRDGFVRDFVTPARPGWVRGRFDDEILRAPGLPVDGGPAERETGDKPTYLTAHPPLRDSERRALREVARQRAESLYVLDQQVEKVVRHLKRVGEYRDTVLVFTSDNGYFLGEHRIRKGKTKAHEPSLQVPLLVHGPRIGRGTRYDPVTTVDLTATIADLAGVADRMPHPLDGRSTLPVIREGDDGWDHPVLTEALVARVTPAARAERLGFTDARTSIGIRTGRYKLTRYASGESEFYDLLRDPNELRNLADSPRYRDERRALRRLWWQMKDCRGDGCDVALPPGLDSGADQTRRQTERQDAGRARRYGHPY